MARPTSTSSPGARLRRAVHGAVRRAGIEVGLPGGRVLPVGVRRVHVPGAVPRDAVLRGEPVVVDIRRVVTPFGFSYADDGWHPYWRTLQAHLADPDLTVADSPLQRFFDTYQPRTAAEALFPERPDGPAPLDRVAARYTAVLWTMNGRAFDRAARETAQRPTRRWNMNFGPGPAERVAAEFRRCVEILDSIRTHGYRPCDFADGVIDGFFLADGEDHRFLPTEGQHRLGALRALGIDDVVVRTRPGITTIRREDLDRWTPAHGGPYPPEVATALFDRYFETRGRPGPGGAP